METSDTQEIHATHATKNILHISTDDSAHKRGRTIRTTPVVWI